MPNQPRHPRSPSRIPSPVPCPPQAQRRAETSSFTRAGEPSASVGRPPSASSFRDLEVAHFAFLDAARRLRRVADSCGIALDMNTTLAKCGISLPMYIDPRVTPSVFQVHLPSSGPVDPQFTSDGFRVDGYFQEDSNNDRFNAYQDWKHGAGECLEDEQADLREGSGDEPIGKDDERVLVHGNSNDGGKDNERAPVRGNSNDNGKDNERVIVRGNSNDNGKDNERVRVRGNSSKNNINKSSKHNDVALALVGGDKDNGPDRTASPTNAEIPVAAVSSARPPATPVSLSATASAPQATASRQGTVPIRAAVVNGPGLHPEASIEISTDTEAGEAGHQEEVNPEQQMAMDWENGDHGQAPDSSLPLLARRARSALSDSSDPDEATRYMKGSKYPFVARFHGGRAPQKQEDMRERMRRNLPEAVATPYVEPERETSPSGRRRRSVLSDTSDEEGYMFPLQGRSCDNNAPRNLNLKTRRAGNKATGREVAVPSSSIRPIEEISAKSFRAKKGSGKPSTS